MGKGIAIAGIWLGVGIVSHSAAAAGPGIVMIGMCAAAATFFAACASF